MILCHAESRWPSFASPFTSSFNSMPFLLRPDMVSIRQVSRHDHEKRHNVCSLPWTYFVYTSSSFSLSLDHLMEQVMKMMWTFVAFFSSCLFETSLASSFSWIYVFLIPNMAQVKSRCPRGPGLLISFGLENLLLPLIALLDHLLEKLSYD